MMETFWVSPPESVTAFASEEALNIVTTSLAVSRGQRSPNGRRDQSVDAGSACPSVSRGQASPVHSSRAHSPASNMSPMLLPSASRNSAGVADTVRAVGGIAALRRQALIMCGTSESRLSVGKDDTPGPSPGSSRISLAIPPAIPADAAVDHPAVEMDAFLENLMEKSKETARPAPASEPSKSPLPSPSASSDVGCKVVGQGPEDWC
jgi:hypothetical protein